MNRTEINALNAHLKDLRNKQNALDEALQWQEVTIQLSPKIMSILAYNNFNARDLDQLVNQCLETYLPAPDAYVEPVTIEVASSTQRLPE